MNKINTSELEKAKILSKYYFVQGLKQVICKYGFLKETGHMRAAKLEELKIFGMLSAMLKS